jgi:hypothetical protein
MSLRKFCSPTAPVNLKDGRENPLHCATSPRCEERRRRTVRFLEEQSANLKAVA